MDRPGELIRRASSREGRIPRQTHRQRDESMCREEELPPAPRPVSRHSSYTALMRSHDRVHTRHIDGRR